MVASNQHEANGVAKNPQQSEAYLIASKGLTNMRQVNNVTGALLRDTLGNRIEDHTARAAVSEIRTLHRGIKLGQEVGDTTQVLDLPPLDPEQALLARREAELLAELNQIRERRGG